MKSLVLRTLLCDVIFLVRLQGKFEIRHSWETKGLFIISRIIARFANMLSIYAVSENTLAVEIDHSWE